MSYLYTEGSYTLPSSGRGRGGYTNFYLANYTETDSFVLDSDGVIGTFSYGAGATTSYTEFKQRPETISANETIEKPNGRAAGPLSYSQTVIIELDNLSAADRNKVKSLNQGQFRIILKDRNGVYKMIGYDSPAEVTAMEFNGGKAEGEGNMVTITFTSKSGEPIYFINTAAALTALAV